MPAYLKPARDTISIWTLCAIAALVVAWFLLKAVLPKIAAIAWTTAKEALVQPLFYILLVIGMFLDRAAVLSALLYLWRGYKIL